MIFSITLLLRLLSVFQQRQRFCFMKLDSISIHYLPCPLAECGENMVTSTAPVYNLAAPGIVGDQIHSVPVVVVLLEYGIGLLSDNVSLCVCVYICLFILFSSLGIIYNTHSSAVIYSV